LKRKEYNTEDEVRFVTAGSERDERGGILLKNLQPQDWISAIRLWPGLKRDEESSIRKVVVKFIPQADCEKSDLFSGPTDAGISDFEEMLSSDVEHEADLNWRTGEDGIPASLKGL
jgi:hypothetical protein